MVPDYQSLMLPILKLASDRKEHRIGDVVQTLGAQLNLSEAELGEMLPSGRQPVFNNRVHWAKTYLSQAKLLEITRRAHFTITQRGIDVLAANPERLDNEVLQKFAEFRDFQRRAHSAEGEQAETPTSPAGLVATDAVAPLSSTRTPDEVLRGIVAHLDTALSSELLSSI